MITIHVTPTDTHPLGTQRGEYVLWVDPCNAAPETHLTEHGRVDVPTEIRDLLRDPKTLCKRAHSAPRGTALWELAAGSGSFLGDAGGLEFYADFADFADFAKPHTVKPAYGPAVEVSAIVAGLDDCRSFNAELDAVRAQLAEIQELALSVQVDLADLETARENAQAMRIKRAFGSAQRLTAVEAERDKAEERITALEAELKKWRSWGSALVATDAQTTDADIRSAIEAGHGDEAAPDDDGPIDTEGLIDEFCACLAAVRAVEARAQLAELRLKEVEAERKSTQRDLACAHTKALKRMKEERVAAQARAQRAIRSAIEAQVRAAEPEGGG